MKIKHISECQHHIPELSELRYKEWQDLYQASGLNQDDLTNYLSAQIDPNSIPCTLVILDGDELVGGASIKPHEDGTKKGISPWVGGVYIKREYRAKGLGLLVLQALEEKAKTLGVKALYLSADSAIAFYEKNGWSVLEYVESCGVRNVAVMTKTL